ncbi:N-terminal domain of NEFA-interacting nuclear protein NIP30-domain-containing protein [Lipomyces japonicus]|uniref:N-terminal domain of NEFA-interacting nuclear protein NIP30-domain-containing protein n=1 Tax=Lipomyces japonicus TaxID=56871 RepID=UPI0034CE9F13
MSSRFVSGGTAYNAGAPASSSNATPLNSSHERTKSLYEVLQANKEKKQNELDESFAERNQLHKLDDDEIEFLDSLREKEQEKEEQTKEELAKGLKEFRKLQRQVDLKMIRSSLSKNDTEAEEKQTDKKRGWEDIEVTSEQVQERKQDKVISKLLSRKRVDAKKIVIKKKSNAA